MEKMQDGVRLIFFAEREAGCRGWERSFLKIAGAFFFRNHQQAARSFLEILSSVIDLFWNCQLEPEVSRKKSGWPYGSAWLWKWIQRMGAVAPIPPRARSSAAPDGAPQRRIGEEKTALAPPCPVRGPEAGRHHSVFYKSDLLNSEKKIQKDLTPSSQAPASKTVPYNSPGQRPPSRCPDATISPRIPAIGPDIDEVVGRLDHVQVVLDHDNGVALLHEIVKHLDQFLRVVKVEPGGRLSRR